MTTPTLIDLAARALTAAVQAWSRADRRARRAHRKAVALRDVALGAAAGVTASSYDEARAAELRVQRGYAELERLRGEGE